MVNYASELAGWYAWFTQLSIVPSEYQYVMRMISAFFITLGLLPLVPIILFIIYDLGLWLFRLAAAARGRREILRVAGALDPVAVAATYASVPLGAIPAEMTGDVAQPLQEDLERPRTTTVAKKHV